MKKKVIGILLIAFIVTFIYLYNHNDETKLISKTIKYNGSNLMISIDGIVSNTLPISGSYYLASYDCKSSNTKITWDSLNYKLSVSNGNKKGGIACYLNFETTPKLTDMELGSYVSYVGNNGCPEGHCDGTNANYVSDTDMGYCPDSSGNFVVNGWRVAYIKENSAYLISAGAPECMCTSESGSISDDYCDSAVSYETVHIDNLDDRALKYCNKNYVDGGVCNYDTAWSFETDDFKNITGNYINSCANTYSNMSCGYNNDLIDIGSSYWFADTYSPGRGEVYFYDSNRIIDYYNSIFVYGMRPVIKLDSNVLVTGGSGTYDDPYTIGNNAFWVENGATQISNANKGNVTLNLMTVNATQMCVSVNTSVCTNYVNYSDSYTMNWSGETAGEKLVYVYYKDANGRVVASMNRSVTLLA